MKIISEIKDVSQILPWHYKDEVTIYENEKD